MQYKYSILYHSSGPENYIQGGHGGFTQIPYIVPYTQKKYRRIPYIFREKNTVHSPVPVPYIPKKERNPPVSVPVPYTRKK